jgi:hypothetical protein
MARAYDPKKELPSEDDKENRDFIIDRCEYILGLVRTELNSVGHTIDYDILEQDERDKKRG